MIDSDEVIHRFFVGPRTKRSEGQYRSSLRHRFDDEHTWHLNYNVAEAPSGVTLPKQDRVPLVHTPVYDEQGRPDLSYTLGQDLVGWYSQGPVVERNLEKLGESDKGLILFRRMLKEQMKIVEEGGEPTIGVFHDPELNEILSTVIHADKPEPGAITKISLSGNMGRTYPSIRELEARYEETALAAAGAR